MEKRELKKVIKEMVRDAMTEIFAEIQLESIVKKVVNENKTVSSPRPTRSGPSLREASQVPLNESVEPQQARPVQPPAPKFDKDALRAKIGIDEDTWKNIYSDTAESDNPVLTGEQGGNPEFVAEEDLVEAGLMKDYSKFI